MARSQATDFFHNMRYRVRITSSPGVVGFGDNEGGFATCSAPELTIEMHEYKTGMDTYKKKFPGNANTNTITLTRGVVKNNTALMDWILACVEGREYRADIFIDHYHRDDYAGNLAVAPDVVAEPGRDQAKAAATRGYQLYNAFPVRVKAASDFDGQGNEVSMEEIDIDYESFKIIQ